MASTFSIAYFANHDLLGAASEEEYERFKEQLLQWMQDEWPDAAVTVDDDEEVYAEIVGIGGQAEVDVRNRISDIVTEVIDSAKWQDQEEDLYDDDDDEALGEVPDKDDY